MNKVDYFTSSAISNSDINNFLVSPELFLAVKQGRYKMFENTDMRSGSIKHKMILEKDSFYDEYFIQEESLSQKQKEFIDNIIASRARIPFTDDEIIDKIHKAVYSTSKKGDGVSLYKKLATRIDAEIKGKKAITGAEWREAKNAFDITYRSTTAANLLGFADIREKEIFFRYRDLPCKNKIDACGAFFEEQSTGIIVDVKTHSKPQSKEEFLEKIKKYNIAQQLTYYEIGLRNAEGYKDIFGELKRIRKFIMSIDPVSIRIYEVSDETAKEKEEIINKTLDEIKDTLDNNKWFKGSESWILV